MIKEANEAIGVNAVVLYLPGHDLSLAVDGSCDGNGFETNLLFWNNDRVFLSNIPNFWFNLRRSKHCFVHVEDVLPPLAGLQPSSEAIHSTLPLVEQLTRGQRYLHSKYTLLDTEFFVELPKALFPNFRFGEGFVEKFGSLFQVPRAQGEKALGAQ